MLLKCLKMLLFLTLIIVMGCYGSDVDDPTAEYSIYDTDLDSDAYASAIVYYPNTPGKHAAVTLSGGLTNVKEDMDWISKILVKQNIIVIAFTPNNIFGRPADWQPAHNGAIEMLKELNTRCGCPVYGKIDTARLGMIGFSMGGGGALMAANDNISGIKAVVGMSPCIALGNVSNEEAIVINTEATKNIAIPTYIYSGTVDQLSWFIPVKALYKGIPSTTNKMLIYWDNIDHFEQFGEWSLDSITTDRMHLALYINAWLQLHLNNNTAYQTYIDGAEQVKNQAAGWFNTYTVDDRLFKGDCSGCW